MKVEQFDKLPGSKVVYVSCDCGPVKVCKWDKHYIARMVYPEMVRRRVWLTREAALAAALKTANAKIAKLRQAPHTK